MKESGIEGKYIDLHCHGGGGYYFSDPDPSNVEAAIAFHKSHGTSRLLASLVTESIDDLKLQIKRLLPFFKDGSIAGIHLEGPYLAAARCGAHNPNLLKRPSVAEITDLISLGEGAIKMITIAPELDGALEAISYLSNNQVIAAIGHSAGTYESAMNAVDAGAGLVTHFSNGMSKLKDGDNTFASALLYDTNLPLELIVDGHHVSADDVSVITEVAGDRIVFVTDAMAASGQPDGDYLIGDLEVVVSQGVARLKSNGALAGSTLTMEQAVKNAHRFGISEELIESAAITLPQQLLRRVS